MTSKQTSILLSVIIFCLLVFIGFLIFNKKEDNIEPLNLESIGTSSNPTDDKKIVQVETTTTTANPAVENEESWKTYTDNSYNFSIDYPSASRVGKIEEVGPESYFFEIKNLPDYLVEEYSKEQYYMQLGIFNDDSDCRVYLKDPIEVKVGELKAYRGKGADAPFRGYRFALCTVKNGIHYTVTVTGGDKDGLIANRMIDSFRFTD